MIKYMTCFLVLAGCQQSNKEYGEFEAYINTFITEAASRNRYLTDAELPPTVKLAVLRNGLLGVCKGTGDIEINSKYWSQMSEACKEKLMMHELGHCSLKLSHSTGIMAEVMVDYNTACQEYLDNRSYYLNQLFGVQ